ncbi:LexA family protein [Paenibacillus aceti]|uniref:LexA repressor DNA-binding domain-containing protein n=1 Tax=Paenibacillus aceti TaxID=1820010 RepID=A0ABQ1VQF2_9BACL|nr:hypothetical protein GCM10010913_05010 [Paenibacillus aceti]
MKTQQRILDFIAQYQQENGYSPTFREIGIGVGLKSSSTVAGHIERLEQKGLIRRIHGSGRAIEIVPPDEPAYMEVKIRRRVSIHVKEVLDDGTFKTIEIGGNRYVLESMG